MPNRRQVLAAGLGGLAIIAMPSWAREAGGRSSRPSPMSPGPAGRVQQTPTPGGVRLRQADALIVLG